MTGAARNPLFQALLDAAADAIVVIDERGRIREINTSCAAMFGHERADLVGQRVNALMPERYAREHENYVRHYLDTGVPKIIGIGRTVEALRADGTEFPIELAVGEGIFDGERLFVGILRDLTKRTELLRRLQDQQAELDRIFSSALVPTALLDSNGTIRSANRTMRRFLGKDHVLDEEELVACNLSDFAHPEDRALVSEAIERGASERFAQVESERRFFNDSRTRTVDLYLAPTPPTSSEPVEIVVQLIDRTAELAAQESERALRNRLAHYHRVSLVGAMAAGIAHEVNQPLGAIANYAQASRNQLAGHPDFARADAWLEKIIEQSNRASEVIRHLRSLAGGQRAERELLLPEDILRRTVQLSRRLVLDQDVELALDLDDTLPAVRIDLVQIQQVLLNLLNNAIEALDSQASVDGPRRIVLGAHRAGSTVRFSVRDSGPGIDPQAQDRLLDPFFTSKPDGMGMGLAICNSILEAHDGNLWFENHPDGGAVFHVDLPAQHGGEA